MDKFNEIWELEDDEIMNLNEKYLVITGDCRSTKLHLKFTFVSQVQNLFIII